MGAGGIAESVIKILMYTLGWAAARQIDSVIGKWVAWCMIAWENAAGVRARASFDQAMTEFKAKMAQDSSKWEEWRKKVQTGGSP